MSAADGIATVPAIEPRGSQSILTPDSREVRTDSVFALPGRTVNGPQVAEEAG